MYVFYAFSSFFSFVTEKDGKTCLNADKDDIHQQTLVKHPFTSQNTQVCFKLSEIILGPSVFGFLSKPSSWFLDFRQKLKMEKWKNGSCYNIIRQSWDFKIE